MRNDIVTQLRDTRYPGQHAMREAAADEIERLRASAAATPASPDDDWEERGAADELRKAVIEECIAAIDKFVGKGSVVAFRVRATLEATPVSRLKEQP